jgi:hypothetical protein
MKRLLTTQTATGHAVHEGSHAEEALKAHVEERAKK